MQGNRESCDKHREKLVMGREILVSLGKKHDGEGDRRQGRHATSRERETADRAKERQTTLGEKRGLCGERKSGKEE